MTSAVAVDGGGGGGGDTDAADDNAEVMLAPCLSS